MKRIYIIALFIALCTGIMSAQTTIFDRYADTDGVTTVYISKAMLRMMPDVGEGAGGLNIGHFSEIARKQQDGISDTCQRTVGTDAHTDHRQHHPRRHPQNDIREMTVIIDLSKDVIQ